MGHHLCIWYSMVMVAHDIEAKDSALMLDANGCVHQ
jgi:hypothetical protein